MYFLPFFDSCSWIVEGLFFFFFNLLLSVLAAAFLLSQRTQINGGEEEKKMHWCEKQMSKKGLFKVAHRGIQLLEVGQGRWKTIL